jgi:tetratricopeptide (TPR) repeat protein
MPKDFAERALAWLQLRAMVKGIAPVDKEFIGRQFEGRLAEAASAQKAGDILAAVRDYREIAQDFTTFRDVKEQEALAKSLAASEEFRKAAKNEKATLDLQDEVTRKIGNVVAGIAQGADARTGFMAELQSAANEINREQHGASDPARKQAIERGLASAFSFAVESGQQAMLKKDFLAAKDMFQAGEVILPESAWASYLVATAAAQLGEKKQAIQQLKKALEKGMTNPKSLEDAAFDRIRNDEAFKELSAKLAAGKQP